MKNKISPILQYSVDFLCHAEIHGNRGNFCVYPSYLRDIFFFIPKEERSEGEAKRKNPIL